MAGNATAAIGKRHAIVTVSNLPGGDRDAWSTLSGGAQTAPVTRNYNGGSGSKGKANIIPGRVTIADIVVTRPFEPGRDQALHAALSSQVSQFLAKSVTKQYVDLDGIAVGKPTTFTGCLLTAMTIPDYDESSGDGAFMSLTFSPQGVA